MIIIDGSHGEGGGQILRSALALSIIANKPVQISKIRANRPSPGIKPQHHTVIKILKTLSNANVEGLTIGSTELQFHPGNITSGSYEFDVGTAGSIVLIYQSILLGCLKTKQEINIQLTGGTDVKWSPSWDYFNNVFLETLKKIGIKTHTQLIQRGYYPKGGGKAMLTLKPIEKLTPIHWDQALNISKIHGIIHSSGLPDHIAQRMKHTIMKTFLPNNIMSSISIETGNAKNPGTGLTLWTKEPNGCIGAIGLGEKGTPAETIAKNCSDEIMKSVLAEASVDDHLFDQIIPFLVLSSQESNIRVKEISNHATTNMWVTQQFFPNTELFEINKNKQYSTVTIHPQNIL